MESLFIQLADDVDKSQFWKQKLTLMTGFVVEGQILHKTNIDNNRFRLINLKHNEKSRSLCWVFFCSNENGKCIRVCFCKHVNIYENQNNGTNQSAKKKNLIIFTLA